MCIIVCVLVLNCVNMNNNFKTKWWNKFNQYFYFLCLKKREWLATAPHRTFKRKRINGVKLLTAPLYKRTVRGVVFWVAFLLHRDRDSEQQRRNGSGKRNASVEGRIGYCYTDNKKPWFPGDVATIFPALPSHHCPRRWPFEDHQSAWWVWLWTLQSQWH